MRVYNFDSFTRGACTVLDQLSLHLPLWQLYVVVAAVLLLAETALIAGLLLQSARRRQAEDQVRQRETELRASYERIRTLARRLLGAHEAERARIARELHDDISQQVALLAIDLDLLTRAGDDIPGGVDGLAHEALDRVHGLARSVRDLSHRLHPAKLQLTGLVPALGSLQREFSQPGMAIAFSHENVPALRQDLTLCLFRIVQEALQNAVKHSRACEVAIRLSGGPEGLTLTITDNGVGFDVDAVSGSGLGLPTMAQRLEPFGGALRIRTRPGAGTRLEISVPSGVVRATAGSARSA